MKQAILPASIHPRVAELLLEGLPHSWLVVGHHPGRIECREPVGDEAKHLSVERQLAGRHDDRKDAQRVAVVVGQNAEDLRGPQVEVAALPWNNPERPVHEEVGAVLAGCLEDAAIYKDECVAAAAVSS